MRLGASPSRTAPGSRMRAIYGQEIISERHRHRYEVSNLHRARLAEAGLLFSAFTLDGELVEAAEWQDHPWGLGVQFHPEFKSKPVEPHPLFASFVAACLSHA